MTTQAQMENRQGPSGFAGLLSSLKEGFKDRRKLYDRLAAFTVSVGGITIIFSILAILFVILFEVFPLFKSAKIDLNTRSPFLDASKPALAMGMDEYRESAYAVTASGIELFSLAKSKKLPTPGVNGLGKAKIVSVNKSKKGFLALGLSDGRVLPVRVKFLVEYGQNNIRSTHTRLEPLPEIRVREDGQPIKMVASAQTEKGYLIAVPTDASTVMVFTIVNRKTLMGTTIKKEFKNEVSLPIKSAISALVLDSLGERMMVGTETGEILRVDLEGLREDNAQIDVLGAASRQENAVTSLGFLNGEQVLVVGHQSGVVQSYQIHRDEDGRYRMFKAHDFQGHNGPAVYFDASPRDKGFVTGTAEGTVTYHYNTSGDTQYSIEVPDNTGAQAIAFSPKTDGIAAVNGSGEILLWDVDNPHPDVSWNILFGKVIYEGYQEEAYVWQSTGGSDEFEPKFSLIPLLIGTLKGTFYALIFAVPLALFGAFYASQFMHPSLKGIIKPAVEIMAALPSVVLGFFAALWLAPEIERILPGMVIAPFVVMGLIFVAMVLFYKLPRGVRKNLKPGTEILLLMIVFGVGGWISVLLGEWIQTQFLQGDYRFWLNDVFSISYDQRNSLVVGLAMGFSVIPLIFTISEDSLSSVPGHLTATSLALGATPWQTAVRIVLPTASPGIFSAIMIGFGRAIGETMIVLMATGNTPVMDWSMFSGFRALSANIAVELPEAPEGGTLFRILFMAAFLLFVMTFIVNTLAEYVRLKLRERYRVL